MSIPKNHPRAQSLKQRELLEKGLEQGIVVKAGLIAFGRGEAFDYLLGEKTNNLSKKAIRASAALLLLSKTPIFSVNGNTACLIPKEIARLSKIGNIGVEVNIFYPPKKRRKLIAKKLLKVGIKALGTNPSKKLKNLSSQRGLVDKFGIWKADTVIVAIEDGDRTTALKKSGKKIIAIDLNPLSRTAQSADITIVDNAIRAIPLITKELIKLKHKNNQELKKIVIDFKNKKNLLDCVKIIKREI